MLLAVKRGKFQWVKSSMCFPCQGQNTIESNLFVGPSKVQSDVSGVFVYE